MTRSNSYLNDPPRPGASESKPASNRPGINSVSLVLITIAVIGIVYGLCLLLVSTVITGGKEHTLATQKRILYATDPVALMAACKQLAVDQTGGVDPTSTTVPGIIHRVDPKSIVIKDGHVILECGTADHRFGVYADPAATKESAAPPMSVRELQQGLWYYAEDGKAPPP